jgi:ABC-type antimicrobial peptide transport system permease subunit
MAPTLTVLAGAVALLLLIACVNLASLLLNRSASRAHEFGVRAAIGGSRWSLIRQLLIEHALLVGAGGVLGALGGAAILTGLISVAPPETPRLDEIRLDLVVLSFTTLFSCLCVPAAALRVPGAVGRDVFGPQPHQQHSALVPIAVAVRRAVGLMVHCAEPVARRSGFDPHNLQTVMFSLAGPVA